MINPILHADTPEKAARYRVEPYVVAADVYSVAPHLGRGGWTWYTGSASWMYRLGVEAILGLKREGEFLRISPCIPREWTSYQMRYRFGSTNYHIKVENPHPVTRGVIQIRLDDVILPGDRIPLDDDGRNHQVLVILGAA